MTHETPVDPNSGVPNKGLSSLLEGPKTPRLTIRPPRQIFHRTAGGFYLTALGWRLHCTLTRKTISQMMSRPPANPAR